MACIIQSTSGYGTVATIAVWFLIASVQVASAAAPPITAIAVAPDMAAVVVGSQAGVEIRSWPSLERQASLPAELANVHDLAFSADGKILAVAGGHPAVEGNVELHRWPEQDLLQRVSLHDDVIYSVAWRQDGRELALASGDHRVSIVDAAAASLTRYLEGHSRAVLAVAYLPNDAGLLSAGVDQSIRLWDTVSATSRRALTNHTRAVNDLKLCPNADSHATPLIASAGDDRTVRFWQPTIGRLVRFVRLQSAPSALAWSADGEVLWAACRDGRLRSVDPETATVLKDLPAIDGVAYALDFAPNGRILVGGSNGQLRAIDVRQQ